MSESILTVVEEMKGFALKSFASQIYDPNFWLPSIPMAHKQLQLIGEKEYAFEIADRVSLDPTNTITQDFRAKGTIKVTDFGNQGEKGSLWELKVHIPDPEVAITVRVRAKDLPNALKVGIYVTQLDFDMGLLVGFGRDAILFAARIKIRDFMQSLQKRKF